MNPSHRSKGRFLPKCFENTTDFKILKSVVSVDQIRELMEEECLQDMEVRFRYEHFLQQLAMNSGRRCMLEGFVF